MLAAIPLLFSLYMDYPIIKATPLRIPGTEIPYFHPGLQIFRPVFVPQANSGAWPQFTAPGIYAVFNGQKQGVISGQVSRTNTMSQNNPYIQISDFSFSESNPRSANNGQPIGKSTASVTVVMPGGATTAPLQQACANNETFTTIHFFTVARNGNTVTDVQDFIMARANITSFNQSINGNTGAITINATITAQTYETDYPTPSQ